MKFLLKEQTKCWKFWLIATMMAVFLLLPSLSLAEDLNQDTNSVQTQNSDRGAIPFLNPSQGNIFQTYISYFLSFGFSQRQATFIGFGLALVFLMIILNFIANFMNRKLFMYGLIVGLFLLAIGWFWK